MVFVHKELKIQENMSLYCEVRQFINYVRTQHGSTFRNVALNGLIESTKIIMKYEKMICEKHHKNGNDIGSDSCANAPNSYADFAEQSRILKSKLEHLSTFKPESRNCKNGFDSDWSTGNELVNHRSNSPFPEENISLKSDKRNYKPFVIGNWFKTGAKVDLNMISQEMINIQQESESLQNYLGTVSEVQAEDKYFPRDLTNRQTIKGYPGSNFNSIVQKSALSKAKKRMDLFKYKFGKNKIKQSSFEDTPDLSRKNSLEYEKFNSECQELMYKQSKNVPLQILKDGMLKFQFLLDACTPGTIPDAQLVAAMLDLKAPVVARASFLVECCHFVHKCNRGMWPSWMRMNFNFFRPSMGPRSGSQTVIKSRASTTLQKAAGKAFYQWGELLSSRLEDLLMIEVDSTNSSVNTSIIEDNKKIKQYSQASPDEEDFCSIIENGCPNSLKMIACQLLFEITTFLRETYQYLPAKSSRRSSVATQKEKVTTMDTIKPVVSNRRWSMALSNVGLSNASAHSLISLANLTGHSTLHSMLDHCSNERRISFVLQEAEIENDSINGSNGLFFSCFIRFTIIFFTSNR